jgi:hypothetical protein
MYCDDDLHDANEREIAWLRLLAGVPLPVPPAEERKIPSSKSNHKAFDLMEKLDAAIKVYRDARCEFEMATHYWKHPFDGEPRDEQFNEDAQRKHLHKADLALDAVLLAAFEARQTIIKEGL